MRYTHRYILLMIILACYSMMCAANDSIIERLPDGSVFKGVKINSSADSTSSMYHGVHNFVDFTRVEGFFRIKNDTIDPLFIRFTNAAHDTIFINSYSDNVATYYHRAFYTPTDYFQIDSVGVADKSLIYFFVHVKRYTASDQKWSIFNRTEDYQWGTQYTPKRDSLRDISSDEDDSPFMWKLHYLIMIILSMAVILYPFVDNDKHPIRSRVILIGACVALVLSFLVDTWTQKQITFVFFSFVIVYFISFALEDGMKNKKMHAWLHCLLCATVLASWAYYLFLDVDDHATLSDGTEVPIKWRSGTDYCKRRLIKKIFHDMMPVEVNDHGKQYTVYVNKYEFSETEFAVLNDDMYEWISALFGTHDEPKAKFSFRESQIVLGMIQQLTNVRLDFLSYNEWKSASLGKHHHINDKDSELHDVDEGEANELGLVNITGNIAEYTSNYYSSYRIAIGADTIYPSYDDVYVCGSAYHNSKPVDSSVVNKNLRNGSVGFRLIYRPHDIGARRFQIEGHLRGDIAVSFPKRILLHAINGKEISSFDCYESFEEYLIENRNRPSSIEYFENEKSKLLSMTMPQGFGYYDFVPIFSFVGMDDRAK